MKVDEVMQQLKDWGSEQTRKTYRRHGVTDEMFGVSYANLYALRKKIKTDHGLAKALWATANHDARVLATMIADPAALTSSEMESWAKDLNDYAITGAFAHLAIQSPLAEKKYAKWCPSKSEYLGQAGWTMLALATEKPELADAYFEPYLETIEREIHQRKNRVRYAMNSALIAIGKRSAPLQKQALAVAKKIGKVEIDHGDTSCKTPDATAYIIKATEHRKKRAARA